MQNRRFTPSVSALEGRLALSAAPLALAGLPVLQLKQVVTAEPGDEFAFHSSPAFLFGSQYHIAVSQGGNDTVIGIYGPNVHVGKARNKPGQLYIDRSLAKGSYLITVTGETDEFKIVVTKNSLIHKIFG